MTRALLREDADFEPAAKRDHRLRADIAPYAQFDRVRSRADRSRDFHRGSALAVGATGIIRARERVGSRGVDPGASREFRLRTKARVDVVVPKQCPPNEMSRRLARVVVTERRIVRSPMHRAASRCSLLS